MASKDEIRAGAAAIANARAGRRGAPAVANILELLHGMRDGRLFDEVMDDSRSALEAAERVRVPTALAETASD